MALNADWLHAIGQRTKDTVSFELDKVFDNIIIFDT